MYMQNREDDLPYDEPLLGPPIVIEGDLDFSCVFQGERKTLQQVIVNTNKQPVIWLADAEEAHWITLEPDQGVLQPGEQQSIQVTADTASLAVGEYSATITFSSEGDETSMSRKTVSKIVVKSPPAALGAGLNFGSLTPGSTRTLGLLITNPAASPVKWSIAIGPVTWETIEPQGRPGKVKAIAHTTGSLAPAQAKAALILNEAVGDLNPGESRTVDVTASAANLDAGNAYRTTLTVVSQAPNVAPTSMQVPILMYVHNLVHMVPLYNGGPKCPEDLPPHIQMSLPPSPASAPQAQAGAQPLAHPPQKQADTGVGLDFTNPDENGNVQWVLKPEASWLTVDKKDASGASIASSTLVKPNEPVSLAENAKEHVDVKVNRAGLSPGSHTTNLWLILNYEPTTGHDTRIPIPVTVVI